MKKITILIFCLSTLLAGCTEFVEKSSMPPSDPYTYCQDQKHKCPYDASPSWHNIF